MSKIVLDEGAPEEIAWHLPGHQVQSVRQLGLKGTKNGKLLAAIEAGEFDSFISNDKRLEFDQNIARLSFAVFLLSTNHWPTVRPHISNIAKGTRNVQARHDHESGLREICASQAPATGDIATTLLE